MPRRSNQKGPPQLSQTLYRKVNKRYVAVGEEFHGLPVDGLWLIRDGARSMSCICDLEALKTHLKALDMGSLCLNRDKACSALLELCRGRHSTQDIVDTVIRTVLSSE